MAKGTIIYGVYGDESPTYFPTKKEAIAHAKELARHLVHSSADVEMCVVRTDLGARLLMCRLASNDGGWCEYSVQIFSAPGRKKVDK